MDEDGNEMSEKKRGLSVEQVKGLEKYFEVEKKVDQEGKVKLAKHLGLQPRQVAVWFQNRRARWKTKQLQTDYALLKASYDSLKHIHHSLKQDNHSLLQQIRELKSKLYGEDGDEEESHVPVKEQSENKPKSPENIIEVEYFPEFKDGSSDSDSSAILNEDSSRIVIRSVELNMGDAKEAYHPEFVKLEEHDFFSGDESCNFFSDDQAPTLQWG